MLIEGDAKEIAEFVLTIQNQQSTEMSVDDFKNLCFDDFKNLFKELEKKSTRNTF